MDKNNVKKLISIVVPVYNEQDSLKALYERTCAVMNLIEAYEYEIVFFDDGSTDASKAVIEELCAKDAHCKAVFFEHNYGYNSAIFYAVQQAKGDCAVLLHADLQNPPELIPDFIREWEAGHDVVFGVKNKSKEDKVIYFLRTLAYLLFNLVFGMHLIPHATDFELIDRGLIRALAEIQCAEPFLRAILLKKARNQAVVKYTQAKRNAGKSNFTFAKYYELAVSWIVFSSKVLPRRFLCVGLVMFLACLVELFAGFLPHIGVWRYEIVSTPLLVRIGLLLFSVMICFAAVFSEYIIKLHQHNPGKLNIIEKGRLRY